jgi:alpha-tubulin suppressor-like RCC1 family protein
MIKPHSGRASKVSRRARGAAVPVALVVLAGGLVLAARLGDGRGARSGVPVAVQRPAATTVTAVAAGCHHSLAVTSTGQVLAWGANAYGQLGDGTATQSDVPVRVKLTRGTKATAVAGGCFHSLAVTSAGQVLAWGANAYGQLGDGGTARSDAPVKVKLPGGIKATAVAGGCFHSLALTSAGQVLAWGDNADGQLGDGTTVQNDVPVRVKLPAGTKVTAVTAGCFQSVALTSTGQVLAWGDNAYGELGDGSTVQSDVPVMVRLPAGTKVTGIAGGGHHGLAVTSAGQVLAWGENATGQLGDGSTSPADVPVRVKLPAGTKVTAVAGGGHHSLALTSAGRVLAWGENGGQLGDGNTTQSDVPVKAKLPAGTKVTAIAGGGHHSLALTSAGQVLAWGNNAQGQLGDGNTTQSDVPVKVKLPAGAKTTKLGARTAGVYSLALVHHVSRATRIARGQRRLTPGWRLRRRRRREWPARRPGRQPRSEAQVAGVTRVWGYGSHA